MSRLFYHTVQDNAGNLLFDVSGTMRIAGTGTLATIYGDEALTVVLPNPMTNHPNFGSFKCFLGAGDYDFYLAKGGYTFETLTGVQGHGTLAQQDANAVLITGGSILGLTRLSATDIGVQRLNMEARGVLVPDYTPAGGDPVAFYGQVSAGPTRWNLFLEGTAFNYMAGPLLMARTDEVAGAPARVLISYQHALRHGIVIAPSDADTGAAFPVVFMNLAGNTVGTIACTGAATAYNTSSDARLKHAIAPLIDALDAVLALRPVRFRWNADDSADIGFLAHEVMTVAPNAVQGLPDDVNPDGTIQPQQLDQSKLMPLLVAAVKELLARVEVLEQALA